MKFDHVGGYFDNRYGGFGWSRSDLGSDPYGKWSEEYEARGTAPKSSTWAHTFDDYGRSIGFGSDKDSTVNLNSILTWAPTFDDYGRSIGFGSEKDSTVTSNSSKIVRFRFWFKLLPESPGQNTMDVLCQVHRWASVNEREGMRVNERVGMREWIKKERAE